MKTALVTGAAGFVGFHTAMRWLDEGWTVVGIDCFSDYYDVSLKRERAALLARREGYVEVEARIEDEGILAGLFSRHAPAQVIHLAAQAGVRHSIEAPRDYLASNLAGTFELLEAARAHPPQALLLASTSSVYGANSEMPYRETQRADHQMSFYAATKKATEAMAHSYAHLYDLPTTMFRFFTVYGPWGRPDMAYYKFARAIDEDRPIDVYNEGRMARDFTYVDDLVEAVWRLAARPPERGAPVSDGDSLSPVAPFRTVNIGRSEPENLLDFIAEIERAMGKSAKKRMMPMQPGDVPRTHASTDLLEAITGFRCETPISRGVPEFVRWYRERSAQ